MSDANVTQGRLPAKSLMQIISQTPVTQIAELEQVKEKYIENYNACNPEKNGELMYHKQLIALRQAIGNNNQLTKCDPFSIYACFVTAAANGYSLDPQDGEVYLIPRDGKARLDIQAPAKVKRLARTRQIKYADQAKLVYEGDDFEVVNGRVVRHVEKFQSENIIAGYVRMVINEKGSDIFFIYRKSDWEGWRKRSSNPNSIKKSGTYGEYISPSLWDNGIIGGQNPDTAFLRTKIIKHACNEKCWASGTSPAFVEKFEDIEIETEEELRELGDVHGQYKVGHINSSPVVPKQYVDDNSFAAPPPQMQPAQTVSFDDDNF